MGDLLFVSGRVPGHAIVPGDISTQAQQTMRNLMAIARSRFHPGDIVKTTCLLADMADFARFNEVYGSFFVSEPPARETYEVAALPLGARVEVSAICAR